MAVSCTCNICAGNYPVTSLEDFRLSMCCVDQWAFWQWDNAALRKARGVCKDVVFEHPTSGKMSRQNIREALLRSEQMFTNELGYAPVETWFSEEISLNPGYWNGYGRTGLLRTSHARVQAVGTPVYELLGEIEYSGAPGSFGDDQFSYFIPTGGEIPTRAEGSFVIPAELVGDITADEICIYMDEFAGCLEMSQRKLDACITLSADGTMANIQIKPWTMAKRELYESYLVQESGVSASGDLTLDPTNIANYLDALFIYRCTIDRDQAGLVKYNPVGCDGECNPCGCTGCDHDTACGLCEPVNFCIENQRAGLLRPDYFKCTPNMQSVCVHYLAGDCSRSWTRDIAIAAATQLCGVCECGWGCISEWGHDLAHEDAKTSLAFERMNSRFGTKRGEIHTANVIDSLPRRILAGI